MARDFVLCDVFAERPFAGNQLAVFLDSAGMTDETMAVLAREFDWSEITFVERRGNGRPPRVRIWTPRGELPFAGHPTVGTAVVLAAAGHISKGWSLLELGIGPVAVEVTLDGPDRGSATMTQRAPEFGQVFEDRGRVAAAVGLQAEDLADALPAQLVSTGLTHFLVPVRSLAALGLAVVQPGPFASLIEDVASLVVEGAGVPYLYLFTVETPGTAAAARARLVGIGIEDAATGSAAGPLGAYLVHYRATLPGRLDIEQGIEMGRPSRIQVDVPLEGGEIGPVRVTGLVQIWGSGTVEEVGG